MQTLSRDKSLDAFRIEYEKLYRTLKHSHEQEKKLEKKCKSLSEECRQLTAKEERLRVHSREDETQIEALKAELESAWRQVDEASDLEMAGKEQIAKLRVEIAELTRRCEMAENGEEVEDAEDDVSREFIGGQQNITRPGAKKRCGETGVEYSQNLDDGYFGSFQLLRTLLQFPAISSVAYNARKIRFSSKEMTKSTRSCNCVKRFRSKEKEREQRKRKN